MDVRLLCLLCVAFASSWSHIQSSYTGCVFLPVCDIEVSTMRRPRQGLGLCATEKKNKYWLTRHDYDGRSVIEIRSLVYSHCNDAHFCSYVDSVWWRIKKQNIQYCGAVGWGPAVQAGRYWVWFPMGSLEFFIYINFSATLWLWGRLSLWQRTRNVSLGVKVAGV